MKKMIAIVFIALSLLTLSGCGSKAVPAVSASPAETAQPSEAVSSSLPAPAVTPSAVPAPIQTEASISERNDPGTVDVDLTQLSSTMVYSEVYAMATDPEQYIGKTVKMEGLFITQEYNGARLYACIVQDATACCAQGLEFEMAEDLVFPDDFPEPGSEITVVGTFDYYKEDINGDYYIYLVLKNAVLL